MTTKQVFEQWWGQDNLVRVLPIDIVTMNVTQDAKDFLCDIGLPKSIDSLGLAFHPVQEQISKQTNRVWHIGSDYAMHYYILDGTGIVVAFDPEGEIHNKFVNSSVQQLAECLLLYDKLPKSVEVTKQNKEYLTSITRELRHDLALIDPKAIAGDDHFWALVVEDLESNI